MSTGRKTREITFNLKDRGRKHTGQDRTNVNYRQWIDLINSPATQELINTGSMLGYYGHQIRMLFGLNPPETVIVDGKQINISPALRTVYMRCDEEGNVTHRQEFLETPEGEHAMRQYKAKVGGFSTAHDFKKENGIVYPTECCGTDYVLQPNYATNIGDGMLLDSIHNGVDHSLVKATLEASVLEMYDSIHSTNFAMHMADSNLMRAVEAENNLLEVQLAAERRKQLQKEKQENLMDSLLCPTVSLDDYLKDGQMFNSATVVNSLEESKQEKKIEPRSVGGMFDWF